jgi:hypothetical protein
MLRMAMLPRNSIHNPRIPMVPHIKQKTLRGYTSTLILLSILLILMGLFAVIPL